MRYLLLIYANADRWEHPLFLRDPAFLALPEAERETLIAQADALREEITTSGELVEGVALGDPATARTVRGRAGMPVAGDGPFAEAKEQLAGYFVLDCGTRARAEEIAARFPDARLTGVELRPVMHGRLEEDL